MVVKGGRPIWALGLDPARSQSGSRVVQNPVIVQVVSIVQGLRGENLAPLPVLVTAAPSDAVHLLEGVAFGALVSTPLQGNSPGENLRFVRIGRCRRSVGVTLLKDSF
uniref:Uncharacterized protein n=1 Tax=Oryza glumipatula TaxID=40148 RepID=A0A0E0BTQ6_9ORYZ